MDKAEMKKYIEDHMEEAWKAFVKANHLEAVFDGMPQLKKGVRAGFSSGYVAGMEFMMAWADDRVAKVRKEMK